MDKYIISKEEYKNKFNNNNTTNKEKVLEVYRERNKNMKDLMIFENDKFGEIRSIKIDNEAWFVAVDVCKILELKNSRQALRRLDEDEKSSVILNDGIRKSK